MWRERRQPAMRVRAARLEAGLTQQALAERAGVSRTTVGQIEGGAEPMVRSAIAIARALGRSVEELFGY